jgi:glycerol-3-phosphate dehydrogenase
VKPSKMEHILIIGGGGTGAALAHDLCLRGFAVSLFERGEVFSGSTGRHHGLLHSGARYAMSDPAAARECSQENAILRRLAPESLEQNDGLFVALDDADAAERDVFLTGCAACGVPAGELSAAQALAMEPALNRKLKLAVRVPDATMDAWRLPLQFLTTAKANGAGIYRFCEVVGIDCRSNCVHGIRIFDHRTHREIDVRGDLVVNAAGAWSGKVGALAGVQVPVQTGPGVMVSVKARLTNMVINRLHQAGEGDIIVPQRHLSILGTTLWLADDPDAVVTQPVHVQRIIDCCSAMVPAVKSTPVHAAWSAARPLIKSASAKTPQSISRTFDCFDHEVLDGLQGLISIIGGKATTLRAMAQKTADLICRKTGRKARCRTADVKLLHHRLFFKTDQRRRSRSCLDER